MIRTGHRDYGVYDCKRTDSYQVQSYFSLISSCSGYVRTSLSSHAWLIALLFLGFLRANFITV